MADKVEKETLVRAFNKAPGEAVDFLAKKVSRSSWNWWESLDKSFEGSFTIAATASADMVESVRKALLDAQAKGLPFAAFQKQIEPTLRSLGWWGRDPATGATLGTPWRLETIYRTNLQSSFNAGRMERQQKTERFRPLLEYIAVLDKRTRPSHSALDGKVVPASDPFWGDFYPPNGFNCRCRVQSLSEAEARRDGKDVEKFDGKISREEVTINKSLDIKTEVAVVNIGGTDVSPDPGFSRRPSILPPPPDPKGGKYPTTGPALAAKVAAAPKKAKAKAAAVVPPAIVPGPKKAPKDVAEMTARSLAEIKEKIGEIEAAKIPFKFEEMADETGRIFVVATGKNGSFSIPQNAKKAAEAIFSKADFFEQIGEFHKSQTFTKGGSLEYEARSSGSLDLRMREEIREALVSKLREKATQYLPGYLNSSLPVQRIADGKVVGLHSLKQNVPDELKFKKLIGDPPPSGIRAGFTTKKSGMAFLEETKLQEKLFFSDNFIASNISESLFPDPLLYNLKARTAKLDANGDYSDAANLIRLDPSNAGNYTAAHEFTHFVHFKSKKIQDAVDSYFWKRIDGQRIYKSGYGSTADDKFSEAYQGRLYDRTRGGRTIPPPKWTHKDPKSISRDSFHGVEFLTRGVNLMGDSPLDFFVSDPEGFAFIRAALLGDLPE